MNLSRNQTRFADLQYNESTLLFLRQMLDDFTIEVFRKVIKKNKEHKGFVKSRLPDYQSLRKKYDEAFVTLEAQGFIERERDGTSTPYYVTVRGRQLGTILAKEKNSREVKNND